MRLNASDLIDLHTHSTANDGHWQPETLAAAARAADIKLVALTDHDTVAGVAPFARAAAEAGLGALPGVEVSSWWQDSIYHVLLLGIDSSHPALAMLLAGLRRETVAVAARAADRLRSHGHPLPQLAELAGGGEPLPYHVLLAALRAGLGANFEAVVRYVVSELGISLAAGVPLAEVVEAGQAAGGVAVLAHPGRAEFGFAVAEPATIRHMRAASGLDGLEVYHWSHSVAAEATYGGLAAELGLLVSAGSDSHGPRSSHPLRGRAAHLCRTLLERCGIEVAGASLERDGG
ncbi:MAG: PHP domain-containing protein [Chloroflexota bacterium]